MLQITIPKGETYNQNTGMFYTVEKPVTIQLEHSLISIQKWEAKWNKPFLYTDKAHPKTQEETIDYIRCMCLTPNVKEDVFYCIKPREQQIIANYIDAPMTATTFRKLPNNSTGTGKKRIITAEIIYYWMISYNIPCEYRKWHINQLMTLIRVFNEENAPKKKRNRRELLAEQKMINEANRKRFNTKG